jgi:hypothetical protein
MATVPSTSDLIPRLAADPLGQLRRLLSFLDDDDLDLDAIDGEFYWRCCRRDLWDEIEGLKALLQDARAHRREDGLQSEQGQAALDAFRRLVTQFQPDDPNIMKHLLGPAGWVRLRDGQAMLYVDDSQPLKRPPYREGWEERVKLRVFSNRWTGTDVEERIVSSVANPGTSYGDWMRRCWFGPEDVVAVRVAFEFAPAGTEVRDLDPSEEPLRLSLPHIIVTVAPPFPPAGAIARLYDDIVRGERQWHKRLAGAPTPQVKRVALRTWATGLLVGSGRKVDHAISDVCAVMNEPEVTSVQFTKDRLRLVARVPEAGRYVYDKPPRSPLLRIDNHPRVSTP